MTLSKSCWSAPSAALRTAAGRADSSRKALRVRKASTRWRSVTDTGPRSNMGGKVSTESIGAVAPGIVKHSVADDPSNMDQTAHNEIVTDSRPQPIVVDDQAALTGENVTLGSHRPITVYNGTNSPLFVESLIFHLLLAAVIPLMATCHQIGLMA